jgi:octaprenyl-diphosphate synthase
MNLRDITLPIREELEIFDGTFRTAMRSRVAFVDMVARYIVKEKGKRIRPALVLLAARACGTINESTYRGASLVEILHTATLIHDDVVDEADTRRGFPSINAVWKNKIAVLMGDYMLAKGLLLSLDNNDFSFLKTISGSVRRMSEAEILQISKSRSLDIDEPTYLSIISDKTASLLSTCCQIGALSTSSDPVLAEQMRIYGENLGMTFQIRDDLLDYVGRKSITGKPTGLDMKEKKLTLPIIHAFTNAPRGRSKHILSIIKDGAGKKKDLQEIVEFAQEFGGIDYTIAKAEEYSGRAIAALSGIPDSPAKESLGMFVEFVMERSK